MYEAKETFEEKNSRLFHMLRSTAEAVGARVFAAYKYRATRLSIL